MGVIDDMRTGYRQSSMLMKIVWINIGVFVALRLLAIVGVFSGNPSLINTILLWVELPSSPAVLVTRPWTLISYMFAQYDLLHIVFNMLWLYWFGTMFRMVGTSRQLLVLYLYGGIAGAVLFLAGYNALPVFSHTDGWLIGSSASVIAIVTAVAILMPDFKMHLFLIGAVAVKWIAIATIVLVLIGVTGSNAGGEIAHIGGILTGAFFATRLKKGQDITMPASRILDRIKMPDLRARQDRTAHSARSAQQTEPATGGLSPEERRELDTILDKIKKPGYSAHTPAERDRLFNLRRKIK